MTFVHSSRLTRPNISDFPLALLREVSQCFKVQGLRYHDVAYVYIYDLLPRGCDNDHVRPSVPSDPGRQSLQVLLKSSNEKLSL